MFTTAYVWLLPLLAGLLQISYNNGYTWIEDTFPKKVTQEEYIIMPVDNTTGCKIIHCPAFLYYYVFSETCTGVPTHLPLYGKALYLRTSRISIIYAGDFNNWTHLTSLNIEMNPELVKIEPGAFSKLTSLTNLTISNNYKLNTIEPELFNGLINLQELKFIKNNMYHLSEFVLSLRPNILQSLIVLDLSENPLGKITSSDLIPLNGTKVESLSLILCGLSEIDEDAFKPLIHLRTLNLANNNLNPAVLAPLISNIANTSINLTELSVAGNLLHKQPTRFFNAIASTAITDLDVKDNHINILEPELFPVMPYLKKLDISGIMAVYVDKDIINPYLLPNLTTLIAVKNRFPGILESLLLPNLIELDLSDNSCEDCFVSSLFKINEYVFDDMVNLKILKLAKNPLYYIKIYTFYGLNNLEILNLSNCSIFRIDDYSFVNFTKLKELDLSHNKFIMNYSISAKTFTGLINLDTLKLQYSELNHISDSNLFNELINLKYLSLRGNTLTEIDPMWLISLTKLVELDLANNDITEWNIRLFYNNINLKALSLYLNRIRYLTVNMLKDFENLNYLDLKENQWDCTCLVVLNVQDYFLNSNQTLTTWPLGHSKTKCFSPKEWANKELIVFIQTNIDENLCVNIQLLLIIFLSFITVAFLTAGIILIYYLRWHIRYWIFLLRQAMRYNYFPGRKKNNSISDSKYKYDAFVSYSHEDRNFVVRLVSMLETQQPFFNLCVFERDFSVGDLITESVLECLSSSRRTILVLSDSFARSTWCLWEMQLAQHKRLFFKDEEIEPLVIIKIGEIMDRHMTPTLRYLIRTRVYLQWNPDPKKQKVFWQKLRAALAPPMVHV